MKHTTLSCEEQRRGSLPHSPTEEVSYAHLDLWCSVRGGEGPRPLSSFVRQCLKGVMVVVVVGGGRRRRRYEAPA